MCMKVIIKALNFKPEDDLVDILMRHDWETGVPNRVKNMITPLMSSVWDQTQSIVSLSFYFYTV